MTFNEFQKVNIRRAKIAFPKKSRKRDFLMIAIAGEVGEAANLIKKYLRKDFNLIDLKPLIAKEIADVITYCDLMFSALNLNTERELISKWNEVSKRRNYPILLTIKGD